MVYSKLPYYIIYIVYQLLCYTFKKCKKKVDLRGAPVSWLLAHTACIIESLM